MNYRNDWERNSVESIREVMEQDFAFAMNNLPLREESNSKISGAMARHYLGELYLAMDQPSKAVEVLKPLAEGSEYSLITNRFGKNSANPGCPYSAHRCMRTETQRFYTLLSTRNRKTVLSVQPRFT